MVNYALILAAGSGKRMGKTEKPKQFLLVNNKPLLCYSIETFQNNENISEIVVVTSKEYIREVQTLVNENKFDKVKYIVKGGESRQESVYNGLKALKDNNAQDDDVILIHDAARPLVSQDIINRNIKASQNYPAIETAIKAIDTVIEANEDNLLIRVPDRANVYQVQTPQTFKFSLIYKAHQMTNGKTNATDDAQLVYKYLNQDVYIVEGERKNFKVTTIEDLEIVKIYIQ